MIDKRILDQLTKLAYPGVTIKYVDMNNENDQKTITDPKGQLASAIKSGKIGEIVKAIYSNTKFNGKVATDNKGIVKVLDKKGNLQDIKTKIINQSVLEITDSINNKVTKIEFKASEQKVQNVETLQEQLLKALKLKKMDNKEVITLMKRLMNGK